jgi:hypothetical protein
MKDLKMMIGTVVEAYKEDPKEVIGMVVTVSSIFALLWAGLWFVAIIEGNV